MTNDGPRVYVIDDDRSAREAVAELVESMGVRTQTFPSAERFLESYRPELTGCLVSDVRMLGISGVDLLERIVESPCVLPVILITAYADVPLAVRAMRLGAYTLLEKPCSNDALWDAIRGGLELDARRRQRAND